MKRFAAHGVFLLFFAAYGSAAAADNLETQARTILCSREEAGGRQDDLFRLRLRFAAKHPHSPMAGLALNLALHTNLDDLGSIKTGDKELRNCQDKLANQPLLLDMIRSMLATRLACRGRTGAAMDLARKRAMVTNWLICGSFGYYGGAAFYTGFGPETSINLRKSIPGTAGKVRWRRVSQKHCLRGIRPWLHVHPSFGAVFLLAQFKMENSANITFDIATDCSATIRLDRGPQLTIDRFEAELPRERLWGAHALQKGWHRILVKLYPMGRRQSFRLRLLDSNHEPFTNATWETGMVLHAFQQREADEPAPRTVDLPYLRNLRAAARKHPGKAILQAALGIASGEQGLYDDARFHVRNAANLSPHNPWVQMAAARSELSAIHLSLPARQDNRRTACMRALAANPDFVPALMQLAALHQERRQLARTLAICDRILAINPGCLQALAMRARMAIAHNWLHKARQWTGCLARLFPDARETLALNLSLAFKTGDNDKLQKAHEQAAELKQDTPGPRISLALYLSRHGKYKPALRVLRGIIADFTGRTDFIRSTVNILRSMGEYELAARTCRDFLEQHPNAAAVWNELGKTLFAMGAKEKALEAYRQSLAAKPDQHNLRRLVCRLRGQSADYWKKYILAPFANLAANEGRNRGSKTSRLIDLAVVDVYRDGSYSSLTQELVKVQQRSGIQEARSVGIYGPIIEARTILPGGRTLEPILLPGRNSLTMPGVEVNSAIDDKYLMEEPAPYDRFFHFPKWYFRSPDKEEDFVLSRMVVRVPKDFPLVFVQRNFDKRIKFSQKTEGDRIVYTWTARNMPQALHEPGAPDIDELLPFVEVAGRRSWSDINHLLMTAVLGRLQTTRNIRAQVNRLINGASSPMEKVKCLYRFVCTEIDHAGGSLQASQILQQRMGDRNILLMAMLRSAGFEPVYAAVRPRRALLHEPVWEIPQVEHFPLRMVSLVLPGGQRLWLDTRYRYLGCGELLEETAGATAFMIGADKGYFLTIPPLAADNFLTRETREIRIPAHGGQVQVQGKFSLSGQAGYMLKERLCLKPARFIRNLLEDRLGSVLPGATTIALECPGLDKPGLPFREHYTVTVPDMIRTRRDRDRAVSLCLAPLHLIPAEEDDPDNRQTPYHLRQYHAGQNRNRFHLPAGAVNVRLPGDLLIRNRFGYYRLQTKLAGKIVEVTRSYQFTPQRISLADWPFFLQMTRRIQAAQSKMIVWKMR